MGEVRGWREAPARGLRGHDVLTDPLLAELRQDYSRWGLVAEDVHAFGFWTSDLGMRLSRMQKAGLIRVQTEPVTFLRMDVVAIAVPAGPPAAREMRPRRWGGRR